MKTNAQKAGWFQETTEKQREALKYNPYHAPAGAPGGAGGQFTTKEGAKGRGSTGDGSDEKKKPASTPAKKKPASSPKQRTDKAKTRSQLKRELDRDFRNDEQKMRVSEAKKKRAQRVGWMGGLSSGDYAAYEREKEQWEGYMEGLDFWAKFKIPDGRLDRKALKKSFQEGIWRESWKLESWLNEQLESDSPSATRSKHYLRGQLGGLIRGRQIMERHIVGEVRSKIYVQHKDKLRNEASNADSGARNSKKASWYEEAYEAAWESLKRG